MQLQITGVLFNPLKQNAVENTKFLKNYIIELREITSE